MEWVETTGRTVDEAKDAALDELGVDEEDAEFEVVDEPKSGLFGRLRLEARVRARVRPTTPRPKLERKDRKRRSGQPGRSEGEAGRARPARNDRSAPAAPAATEESAVDDEQLAAEQGEVAKGFVTGLMGAFGTTAETSFETSEDGIELRVEGDDLGLLIGPKGATLAAIQELTRTVVHRVADAGPTVRLHVDIGDYRRRRKEALERFTREVAERVVSGGTAVALEPMGSADRKVVHDTVTTIDGVRTMSEGEEPRRRVVLAPEE